MRNIKLFIAVGLLAMLGLGCKSSSDTVKRDPPAGHLISFSYVHSGTMAQPFEQYELAMTDDGSVSLFAHRLGEIHDTVKVDSRIMEEVAKMIIENEIYKYKDHYVPDVEILDGEGWHYSAGYDDETYLSSGGTNAWPSKFALPLIGMYLDSVAIKAGAQNKGFEDWY